eukprot:tig00000246_g21516.t1
MASFGGPAALQAPRAAPSLQPEQPAAACVEPLGRPASSRQPAANRACGAARQSFDLCAGRPDRQRVVFAPHLRGWARIELPRPQRPIPAPLPPIAAAKDKADEDVVLGVRLAPGLLVEYRTSGDRKLGVLEKKDGKRNWFIADGAGKAASVHPKQISFIPPGCAGLKPADVAPFASKARELGEAEGSAALELAWDYLTDGGAGAGGAVVEVAELAELIFSSTGPHELYAVHSLLQEDRFFFKAKVGTQYEVRAPALVEELRTVAAAEASRALEFESFVGKLRAAFEAEGAVPASHWSDEDRQRLSWMEEFAMFGEDAGAARSRSLEVLHAVGRPPVQSAAFETLVRAGLWSPHENIALRKAGIPTSFPDSIPPLGSFTEEGVPDEAAAERLDLTHHRVFTVDDAETEEIDDGLSIERLEGGRFRIWVHIADPSRWVRLGDPLDVEARRRATTVYLPTGPIPMFPYELATGCMSLRANQVCEALSFAFTLEEDGAIADDYEIRVTRVRPATRFTYEDVEEALELAAEEDLQALADAARLRQRWREGRGAVTIGMPEGRVAVRGEGDEMEVTCEVLEIGEARQLVAEMMIACGELAGRYGARHAIPLPYRHQPQPELPSDEALDALGHPWVRGAAVRRCMPKSGVTLHPQRHASLGLECYVQCTSPIRRYGDLLVHYQLKAHILGREPPLTGDEMRNAIAAAAVSSGEASSVERATNRYWALEYLRREGAEKVHSAVVLRWVREGGPVASVILEDLGLEFSMRIARQAALGERILVRVAAADPRADLITLEDVTALEMAAAAGGEGGGEAWGEGEEELSAAAG